ncbi:MAG TPA: Ig-like domain-containing protein [Kofleriaceae bacterium]|nr:Ig-like domain-containing protein [Kofleriaceae bacterium]
MAIRTVAVVSLVALAGCMDAGEGVFAPAPQVMVGSPAAPGERPRGVYIMVPPELETPADEVVAIPHAAPRIIFLNKNGGTYTPGTNNSSTNRSSIPNQTSTVPPWNVSAAGWNHIVTCMQDMFADYNVLVTDVDPGEAVHVEAVVAGRPQDVGMQSGVGGVSPFSCSVIERSIAFTFAEVYGTNYQAICETTAQEVAHSYGLDHEYLCSDPMTYLNGCGKKSFQDTNASCGEYSARSCQCGGSTQNSHQVLTTRLGAADAVAPLVDITAPQDGATVEPDFEVSASASDNNAVTRVELWIDGALAQTDTTAPYSFSVSGLAAGGHALEVRASDGSNDASASINVTVQNATDPNDPNSPNDPAPPDPGGLGSDCNDAVDCNSGLCLADGSGSHCTDLCDPAALEACPAGFDCVATTGNESVCWPQDPGGGASGSPGDLTGGCQTGGSSGGAAGLVLVLALLIGRRRRQHR